MKNNKDTFRNLSSAIAAITWGLWTYYANRNTAPSPIISSVAQATLSFVMTMLSVETLSFLQNNFTNYKSKILTPSLMLLGSSFLISISIHSILKTENIITTILPNLLVGFIFSLITCSHLNKITCKGATNGHR
ncbi:MAG: hypothetical protein NE334_12710 [Lentisphaeraceae bacterium]|nr:hypothetical protein [Lentisphaeraceae bacterium]